MVNFCLGLATFIISLTPRLIRDPAKRAKNQRSRLDLCVLNELLSPFNVKKRCVMAFNLAKRALIICLAGFSIIPEVFSSEHSKKLSPTIEMKTNARCASLSIQMDQENFSEKHMLKYYGGAYALGGIKDDNLNNAYYYHFGRTEGFISAVAAMKNSTESKIAAQYYNEYNCKELIKSNTDNPEKSESPVDIVKRTSYFSDLKDRYENLILFVEGKTDSYVSLYLGFDEGNGRRTRLDFLRVDQKGNVYRNKDYYTGNDNWLVIE
jgi:hypothetical protein